MAQLRCLSSGESRGSLFLRSVDQTVALVARSNGA